jgi:hypothetical protein
VFSAYDAATGVQLWKTRLNDVPNSSPITYMVNRKQYIALTVGKVEHRLRCSRHWCRRSGTLRIEARQFGYLNWRIDDFGAGNRPQAAGQYTAGSAPGSDTRQRMEMMRNGPP